MSRLAPQTLAVALTMALVVSGSIALSGTAQAAPAVTSGNPNGTGVANGRTGGQPMPYEPLPAQPQPEPTPSQ